MDLAQDAPKPDDGTALADLKDPFLSHCCTNINFWIRPCYFNKGKINYTAKIEFQNGNTKGEQNFFADDFPTLVKKVHDFTTALSTKNAEAHVASTG